MGFRTYVGQAVRAADGSVGSLCSLFRRDVAPTPDDVSVVKTIAVAVGIEEKRRCRRGHDSPAGPADGGALYETSLEIGAHRDLTASCSAPSCSRAASIVGAPMGGLHSDGAFRRDPASSSSSATTCHPPPRGRLAGSPSARRCRAGWRAPGEPLMLADLGGLARHGRSAVRRPRPSNAALLGVPLEDRRARSWASYIVADDQQAGPFTDDDVRLVSPVRRPGGRSPWRTRACTPPPMRELAERRRARAGPAGQ